MWRNTKSWSCSYCNRFWTSGMDLAVDESIANHLALCPAVPPRFSGFDDVEMKEPKYQTGQVVAILTHNYEYSYGIGRHDKIFDNGKVDSGKFDKIIQIYDQDGITWLSFLLYDDLPESWVRALKPEEIAQRSIA